MAFLQCEIESSSVRTPTTVLAVLPQDVPMRPAPRATLYLLHGRGQGGLSWVRYTSAERYAEQYNVAVIIPDAARSFYTDMRFGSDYFTYVTDELPSICKKLFRIEEAPAKTYVFGLSMGGYGALKCALTYPERYAGCGAFSAVPDLRFHLGHTPKDDPKYREQQGIFGTELKPADGDDLYKLVEKTAASPQRPELFITCGTEDGLYPMNKSFCSHLSKLGYTHTFLEWPGEHEWGFWDVSLQKAMEYYFGTDTS